MSAGPAPPNPGAPRKGPPGARPGIMAGRGPLIAAVSAVALAGIIYQSMRPPNKEGTPATNPLRTPGVKNIEGAYSNGGATPTHTPAYGGTTMGKKDEISLKDDSASGKDKNKSTPWEKPGMGDSQRPMQPGAPGEAFKEMNYGNAKGK